MRQLIVKQLDYDLTPVAGLALVGHQSTELKPHPLYAQEGWGLT